MSESLERRLSQFTPDAGRFDRDGLLFAAGRASARPNRKWIALVCGLAASQLVTLTLLWPQTSPSDPSPAAPVVAESAPASPCSLEKSEFLALTQRWHTGGSDDFPPPVAGEDSLVTSPPLRAFGGPAVLIP